MRLAKYLVLIILYIIFLDNNRYTVLAGSDINVYINNQWIKVSQKPIIENDRVIVPLRSIVENLGLGIEYDDPTKTVTIADKTHTVTLVIGSSSALVDGQEVRLDAPARIVDGSTLVPLRFVGEALGLKVDWDNDNRKVMIYENEYLLEKAVWDLDLDTTRTLLDEGVNPNSNMIGIPLIHACVDSGNNEMLKLLFDYGADPDAIHVEMATIGGYRTTFANYPKPSIFYFLLKDNIPAVKLFIDNGLNLEIKDNLNRTPLIYAKEYLDQFAGNTAAKELVDLLQNAKQQKCKYSVKDGEAKRPDKKRANSKYIYQVVDEDVKYLQSEYSDISDIMQAGEYGWKFYPVRPFGLNLIYPNDSTYQSTAAFINIVNPLDHAYLEAFHNGKTTMDFRSADATAIYSDYENTWLIDLILTLPTSNGSPVVNVTQLGKLINELKIEQIKPSNLYYNDGFDSYRILFSQKDIDVTENIDITARTGTGEVYNFEFTLYYYRY